MSCLVVMLDLFDDDAGGGDGDGYLDDHTNICIAHTQLPLFPFICVLTPSAS